MRSPLPTLGHVYSLLLQEKAQREIHYSSHFMSDSASLNVHSSKPQFSKPKFSGAGTDAKKVLFIVTTVNLMGQRVTRADMARRQAKTDTKRRAELAAKQLLQIEEIRQPEHTRTPPRQIIDTTLE